MNETKELQDALNLAIQEWRDMVEIGFIEEATAAQGIADEPSDSEELAVVIDETVAELRAAIQGWGDEHAPREVLLARLMLHFAHLERTAVAAEAQMLRDFRQLVQGCGTALEMLEAYSIGTQGLMRSIRLQRYQRSLERTLVGGYNQVALAARFG